MKLFLLLALALSCIATVNGMCSSSKNVRRLFAFKIKKARSSAERSFKVRKALAGKTGQEVKGEATIMIEGKSTDNFRVDKFCFTVNNTRAVYIAYEGPKRAPEIGPDGSMSQVGNGISREMPLSPQSADVAENFCFAGKGIVSKVFITVEPANKKFMFSDLDVQFCEVTTP